MKIESSLPLSPPLQTSPKKEVLATGTGLVIEDKVAIRSDIKRNDPSDPLVAKKILDSILNIERNEII